MGKIPKKYSNYRRGFRHGLKAAAQMIIRFKDSHKNEAVITTLSILANEIPQIGCTLAEEYETNRPQPVETKEEGT